MASPRTQATLLDKLLFIPLIAKVLFAVAYRFVTYGFVATKANKPLKDLVFAALRQNLATVSVAQEQWSIQANTEANYLDLAAKHKFQPETTVLNSGLKLHWLGPKNSEKVILYFHGGGYALPCSPGHVQWLFDLQKELSKKTSVSVILVHYTLTPHLQYPGQLSQAVETLNWVLGKHGKKPSQVAIGGDSAGGNLTLGLMSHLLHPLPDITKVELSEPLATAVLISPWTSFGTDGDSWKRNATSDMLPPEAARRWASLYLGDSPANEYNEPIRADSQFYSGLPKIVENLLVWGGGGEVLIDSIQKSAATLKEAHPKTELVVQKGAAHEDFILDVLLGYKEKGEGAVVVENWLAERL
ncbi:Steryl acetyl hydrolase 1 [Lecanosticta acicola]|uniref:Steryl acetyl hydrolase 1 n=1 Tax=Lecanosticta acicola TaxID=111012 RepID=A0AAI8YUK5_9PEZI|nr:Steryl acetyl hydrolase 1 [Lecanosticta acicola]